MSVGEQLWDSKFNVLWRLWERGVDLDDEYKAAQAAAARKKAELDAQAGATAHAGRLQAEYEELVAAAARKKAEVKAHCRVIRLANKRQATYDPKGGFTDKRDFACPRCWMLSEEYRKMRWGHRALHCDHCHFFWPLSQ